MNKPNYLTFTSNITAASADSRTITGLIVPFGTPGNTSVGPVIFEAGALSIDPANVKLLLQHDGTRPIGRMLPDYVVNAGGITATFKVADTSAGTDSLVEASQGLRDGLSVGAEIVTSHYQGENLVVTAAVLREVSLVTEPAFDVARVSQVAASAEPETTTNEEPLKMELETTAEQPTETADVTVEASKTVTATGSPIFTAPRSPIATGASYLEHSIKASLGDAQSSEWVRAADDSTSTNTGLTLPQHMNSFISNTFTGGRPAIDAISTEALTDAGLSFTIPRVTGLPTVGTIAEGASTSETGMTSDYLTVDVKKASGRNVITWELLDRSSPAFYNELLNQLQLAYAATTDKAVISALAANGTAATVVATTAAGLQSFVATESAAALKGSGAFARNFIASTDHWAAIAGYADTTGRPLYTAYNPMNNAGAVSGQSLTGTVLGTNLYVDPNISTSGLIDDSAFLVAPEAATYYETPTTRLQVINTGNGKVEIALYGYYAVAVKRPLGVRRFNVA